MKLATVLVVTLSACMPPQHDLKTVPPITIAALPPIKVEIVQPPAAPPPAPDPHTWSCAAYCVEKFHCTGDGDSTSTAGLHTSFGANAAEAFKALEVQCEGAHSDLVTHGRCESGKFVSYGASISTSCARN